MTKQVEDNPVALNRCIEQLREMSFDDLYELERAIQLVRDVRTAPDRLTAKNFTLKTRD